MNNEKFGKFVAELRKEKNLTQQELGDELYISDKAISKWERGLSFPDISMLIPLANFFNVSIIELLTGERIKEKNLNRLDNEIINTLKVQKKYEVKKRIKKNIITISIIILLAIISMYAIDYICVIKNYSRPIFSILTYSHHVHRDDADYYENNYYGLFYNYYTWGHYNNGIYEIQCSYLYIFSEEKESHCNGID